MPDKAKNFGNQPPTRINLRDEGEVAFWAQKFGVSKQKIREAVAAAGRSPRAVKSHLANPSNSIALTGQSQGKPATREASMPVTGENPTGFVRRNYERPPILERVLSVFCPDSEENFEANIGTWEAIVRKEFPVYDPLQRWIVKAQERDGIPLLDTMEPEVEITPRYSKKIASENYDWSIRCRPGQFTMNMHTVPNESRSYDSLRQQFAVWLPRWMDHFNISSFEKVELLYVNMLNPTTLPSFTTADNSLQLDKVLKVFVSIPGEHLKLVPPFDCRASLALPGDYKAMMGIHLHNIPRPPQPAVRLDLHVTARCGDKDVSAGDALRIIDWAHERVLERFEVIFTEEAKASFIPEEE